jgi:hypothetical protein
MKIRKRAIISLFTIGVLSVFTTSLEADDIAYMLAGTGGATNPFGTVDMQSGAFTLIGDMGTGSFSGLGVANGVLYTEQNGELYSVNVTNAGLTLLGGAAGSNLSAFGSTTSGLYGIIQIGAQSVPTLVSISATGAQTPIGPVGVIVNGAAAYAILSTGSSTLYMENNGNLYTMNTTTGAGTLVGTESGSYPVYALLFENGTLYVGANGFGVGTVSASTGQIAINSSILGGPNNFSGLAPAPSQNYYFSQLAVGGGWQSTLTYVNYSPQTVTCTTNFYTNSGTSNSGVPLAVPFTQGTISTRTDVLPGGGSIHDQTTAILTSAVSQGWVQATCSGAIAASLLYRYYVNGVATSEAGLNAETAPTTKFATFAQTATGVAYANPSPTQSATITFAVFSQAGAPLASTAVVLGPLAHGSANLGPLLGLSSFTGFVEITSTSPVISLSLNAEDFPVFSALPPGDLPGTTTLVAP